MGESSASRHVLDKIKEHVAAASLRAAQLNSINAKPIANELISGSNDVNGHPINFHRRISSTPRVLPPATKDNKHSLPTPPGSPHDLTLNVPQLPPVPPPWPTSGLHHQSSSSTSSSSVTKSLDFLHLNAKSHSSTIDTSSSSSTTTAHRTNPHFAPSSVVVGDHHVHQQSQRQHQGATAPQVVANSETVGPSAALGGPPTVPSPLSGLSLITQHHHRHHPDLESPIIARALASSMPKRPRGEKHPIPEEQKDDKYFERRKRNNQAAKKSRDARKMREDEIAFRANLLEKENAILRAQVSTLREEANSLRQLLMQKRHSRFQVV